MLEKENTNLFKCIVLILQFSHNYQIVNRIKSVLPHGVIIL